MSGEETDPESIRPGTTPVGEMNPADTEIELRNLARAIQFHDLRYHGEDAPVISDAAYDALVARNRDLEAAFPDLVRDDSPSLRVGAPPQTRKADSRCLCCTAWMPRCSERCRGWDCTAGIRAARRTGLEG